MGTLSDCRSAASFAWLSVSFRLTPSRPRSTRPPPPPPPRRALRVAVAPPPPPPPAPRAAPPGGPRRQRVGNLAKDEADVATETEGQRAVASQLHRVRVHHHHRRLFGEARLAGRAPPEVEGRPQHGDEGGQAGGATPGPREGPR